MENVSEADLKVEEKEPEKPIEKRERGGSKLTVGNCSLRKIAVLVVKTTAIA